jgi:hypothetical protein
MMEDPNRRQGGVTRRTFLGRVSAATLAAFASLAGADRLAAYAKEGSIRRPPLPGPHESIICVPVDHCAACACAGDRYHCTGCWGAVDYHRCYRGHDCKEFVEGRC